MKKIQIFYIHGGTTFKNKKDYLNFLKTRKLSIDRKVGWSGEYFDKALGKNFHVIRPRMPRQDGATYNEWALHFERHLPLLKGDIILVKGSQGMRMERIVKEIMAEPERASELLVRQDASWKEY